MPSLRSIPSIDALLQRPAVGGLVTRHGRDRTVAALRRAADQWRAAPTPDVAAWIETRATTMLDAVAAPSLVPVLNATGVIIHTNLGRAPLAQAARERASAVAGGYSNLEYDLQEGGRGHRHTHAERLLCDLTGAEAAAVANNNAAATMLVLAALAAGREVIVSRGELVEIGGGFRVPDILRQSGAILREVGTTNRTRVNDYAAAISDRTALILRVHPSNFRIEGFTERPALSELAALGQRFNVPVFEDLGSGWLGLPDDLPWPAALRAEPSVRDSVAAGVDLVAFSGDKLLGGPQAGVVVGRAPTLEQVRRHPLMRAVRADKQTYAALEATLALWRVAATRADLPVASMLLMPLSAIEQRALSLATTITSSAPGTRCEVVDGMSTIGGGSAPQSTIPTRLLALRSTLRSAADIEAALRAGSPPVVARVQHDAVLFDLRTVPDEQDDALRACICAAIGS